MLTGPVRGASHPDRYLHDFNAAQSTIFPVMMLAFNSVFVLMAYNFETLPAEEQTLIFAIPFSHPMMLVRELMSGSTGLVIMGVMYRLAFMSVAIYFAVTLFNKDILLTGRIKSAETGWTRRSLLGVLIRPKRK